MKTQDTLRVKVYYQVGDLIDNQGLLFKSVESQFNQYKGIAELGEVVAIPKNMIIKLVATGREYQVFDIIYNFSDDQVKESEDWAFEAFKNLMGSLRVVIFNEEEGNMLCADLIEVINFIKNPQTEESFKEDVDFLTKHVVDRYRHIIQTSAFHVPEFITGVALDSDNYGEVLEKETLDMALNFANFEVSSMVFTFQNCKPDSDSEYNLRLWKSVQSKLKSYGE